MDGVLADFDRGVSELCGLVPQSLNSAHRSQEEDDRMWQQIKKIDHFYDKLELMPGAKTLFDMLYRQYGEKCEILTGIPKAKREIETAAEDKISWVHRLLAKDIKVNIVYREEKPKYCDGPEYILIDDMKKNVSEWNAMGGTGILCANAEAVMGQLRKLGIIDME